MKHPLRIPLHAVLYRKDDLWFAHCLELDLAGHGATKDQAFEMLADAIAVQIENLRQFDNSASFFCPADGRFFAMFAAGKETRTSALEFELHGKPECSVEIQSLETREYEDDLLNLNNSLRELVPA